MSRLSELVASATDPATGWDARLWRLWALYTAVSYTLILGFIVVLTSLGLDVTEAALDHRFIGTLLIATFGAVLYGAVLGALQWRVLRERLPMPRREWVRAAVTPAAGEPLRQTTLESIVIVRERPDSFLLFEQHEHALIAGEFALRWKERPRPFESTVYAIANHDLAWREADREVLWNEEKDRPYSFVDYPLDLKLPAQRRGIDLVADHDPYAGCLCSMHYARFLLDSERPEEVEFREGEMERQGSLEVRMSEEELENLERNFRFLRLCDGLSLFLCLNEPGGEESPPPYPGGFEFEGTRFGPVWEDGQTLRLDPNPFSEAFGIEIPYRTIGRDRRPLGSDKLELRVTC